MQVPFIDLQAQNRALKHEIIPLWEDIFDSSHFIGGKYVNNFEQNFAQACEVEHCISVNSGTDALRFILLALDINPGDEVITVPNTFIATAEAISQADGKVIFVDINPQTYTMNPEKLEAAITVHTKGIVPVHLYGRTDDMDMILRIAQKYNLWVVEDACQAHLAKYKGRKAGSIGIAGAFSFYPGKNLGACGEAGAVTTNNVKIAKKIRMLRDHGQSQKYYHDINGYNGRCDALQAAALNVKLKYLPEWNESRRKSAQRYIQQLQDLKPIILPYVGTDCLPVYHLFVIQVPNRDGIINELNAKGIGTGIHYPVPLHLQKAYMYLQKPKGSFPESEKLANHVLSLPMFPNMTYEQIDYVCNQLHIILQNLG